MGTSMGENDRHTSRLSLLCSSPWAGANARGVCTTSARTIGVGETLPCDELLAFAVTDMGSTVGVEWGNSNNGGYEGEESGDGDRFHFSDSDWVGLKL